VLQSVVTVFNRAITGAWPKYLVVMAPPFGGFEVAPSANDPPSE
jgi:hypothetical protein